MPERRHLRSRVNSWSSNIPQIEVRAPPQVSNMKQEPRDTGFPEPFRSGPNTTLPHPEADLSPNATLSYEDVSGERMLKRHRLSFLKKKNKRTVSYGTLDPQSEALRSIVSLSMFDADGGKRQSHHFANTSSVSSLSYSKDGGDSVHSSSKKDDDDTPPTSPDVPERKKSGLFNRWKPN